jgi:REP element-mobilizing transposase RayT
LKEYDYSQAGAYFVTICAKHRKVLFGDIIEDEICFSPFGLVVKEGGEELDAFIVMPNHVHGILIIAGKLKVGAGLKPAPTSKRHALPDIIRALKTFSARRINQIRGTPGTPVWPRNYYEHVIRNETDLEETREYIRNNLFKWLEDENHPRNIRRH